MSLMSLFVKENHFEATIMVSLTCMLVLYTLFQSIMAGMPVTQYINMIKALDQGLKMKGT